MAGMTVLANAQIAPDAYRLWLERDTDAMHAPGQFYELRVPGFFLRRPFAVCDWDEDSICVVYKLVGAGTRAMTAWMPGEIIDALGPLGNGFRADKGARMPLLVGGGSGVPPLLGLARTFLQNGVVPTLALGFRTAADMLLTDEFRDLGARVHIATEDGSCGHAGFVTEFVRDTPHDYLYACGPLPMLNALANASPAPGQFSLEARMGCGFGACMGCAIETKFGPKRVCKDGPVFGREELQWPIRA